jgi:hypothetical protein
VKKSKREEVLRLLEADRSRSDTAIAKEVGCVTSYVYSIRKQTRGRAEIYAKKAEWIKALLLDPTFESYQQVAKKVGCGSGYVRAIDEQLTAESTAAVTSVSVAATGLSAEVKRSYIETNDLPPAPVEVVTRNSILSTAKSYITRDRQADHGDAEDNFSRIAGYWSLHTGTTLTATDVAVMMALLKVARIKQNPQHVDNWVDGAGYFACGGEIANK